MRHAHMLNASDASASAVRAGAYADTWYTSRPAAVYAQLVQSWCMCALQHVLINLWHTDRAPGSVNAFNSTSLVQLPIVDCQGAGPRGDPNGARGDAGRRRGSWETRRRRQSKKENFRSILGFCAHIAQRRLGDMGEDVLATGQSTAVDHQKCQKCRKTGQKRKSFSGAELNAARAAARSPQ